MFLIVSLLGRPDYDPNPLRSNPNPKTPVSGLCHVHGLDRTMTPLENTCEYIKQNLSPVILKYIYRMAVSIVRNVH